MTKNQFKNLNSEFDHLNKMNPKLFQKISFEEVKARERQSLSGKNQSIWRDITKRFFKNKWNIFFLLVILCLVTMIIVVPILSKFSATAPISEATEEVIRFQKPYWVKDWNHIEEQVNIDDFNSWVSRDDFGKFDKNDVISKTVITNMDGQITGFLVKYVNRYATPTLLGTDSIGRDVFIRLFLGARWSLSLAFSVAFIETVIGIVIGIYVGFHVGRKIDTIIMRFIELFQSVPALLWLFIFTLLIGNSFSSMLFILILVGWVGPVYSARMFTLKVKDAEFIKAAESIGVSKFGRLFRHVLPNIVGRLLVSFVHRIPAVIFFETTLVILGVQIGGDNQISIGNLVQESRDSTAIHNNIYYVLSLCFFFLSFTVSLQILANGIRDAFDPKSG